MAARSKVWVCGRYHVGIPCSNPAGACVSGPCKGCQVEVPASGLSLVQKNPTECGVSVIVKPW